MANKLYDESSIQDIADAIREKNGGTAKYKVSNMGAAIRNLSTSGIDTSDATAIEEAVLDGYTFYAAGEKKTGTLPFVASGSSSGVNGATRLLSSTINGDNYIEIDKDFTGTGGIAFLDGSEEVLTIDADEFGNATAENVVAGATFTSAEGLRVKGTHVCEGGIDTSDATAAEETVLKGYTFYADGEMKTGSLQYVASGSSRRPEGEISLSNATSGEEEYVQIKNHVTEEVGLAFLNGSTETLMIPRSEFGDATAADVRKGKTFTAASGLLAIGTSEELGDSGGSGVYGVSSFEVSEEISKTSALVANIPFLGENIDNENLFLIIFPNTTETYKAGIKYYLACNSPIMGGVYGGGVYSYTTGSNNFSGSFNAAAINDSTGSSTHAYATSDGDLHLVASSTSSGHIWGAATYTVVYGLI